MEAYDSELTDEEMTFLLSLERKRKRRIIIIVAIVGLIVALFIALTISAILYESPTITEDITEQYPFN